MHENIRNYLDNEDCAIGIFLKVDHGILPSKLYNFVIRGVALDCFSSYLPNTHRQAYNVYVSYKITGNW